MRARGGGLGDGARLRMRLAAIHLHRRPVSANIKARQAIARRVRGRVAPLVAGQEVGPDEFLVAVANVASKDLFRGVCLEAPGQFLASHGQKKA